MIVTQMFNFVRIIKTIFFPHRTYLAMGNCPKIFNFFKKYKICLNGYKNIDDLKVQIEKGK